MLRVDSVEKADLLPGLRQNWVINQREDPQQTAQLSGGQERFLYSFIVEDPIQPITYCAALISVSI